MRWICWGPALLTMLGLCGPAAGFEFAYAWGGSCASCQGYGHPYCAGACAGPFYGWQPGCCESPPSCCDNAWAGYCQEKARCWAFCHRLGTGGTSCGAMPMGCAPTTVGPRPVPAAPEEPMVPRGDGVPDQPVAPPGPGAPGEPPAPAPAGEPSVPPLPPEPTGLDEPVALPPVPYETTQRWSPPWLPRSIAREQPVGWHQVR